MDKATNFVVLADSEAEICDKIPIYMTRLQPDKNDDPVIAAIYI